jgi:hypothetical protein
MDFDDRLRGLQKEYACMEQQERRSRQKHKRPAFQLLADKAVEAAREVRRSRSCLSRLSALTEIASRKPRGCMLVRYRRPLLSCFRCLHVVSCLVEHVFQ